MKAVTYKLNTILAALVGVICLAFVLIRTFMPQAILPLVDIPNLAVMSFFDTTGFSPIS